MAINEHVKLLRQGSEVWNAWRKKNIHIEADLSGADLSTIDLSGADLSGADLSNANLSGADLIGIDFSGADLSNANLSGADLRSADLRSADLSGADLRASGFSGADLSNADLSDTILSNANLSRATLSDATLYSADLNGADLSGADLSATDLRDSDLSGADLSSTQFHKTHVGYTLFAEVDLCVVNGLDTIIHDGPSYVDVKTVRFPEGESRTHFLQGAGFSDAFIDYLPSLLTSAIQYESCFISYAHQDELLARRLYKDLQDKGVRCWFAPHDLRPGRLLHQGIEDAIHVHEVVLLLLSVHAVQSNWVAHEVETTLGIQAREGRDVLFPIRLDDAILHTTKKWATRLCESRHIGDFTNWQDEKIYQQRFEELLRHLKVKST